MAPAETVGDNDRRPPGEGEGAASIRAARPRPSQAVAGRPSTEKGEAMEVRSISIDVLPKMLNGSLHLEWRKCGRRNCRCAQGYAHGPYVVRRWREGGRQRKMLVRAEDLPSVLAAIEGRRALGSVSGIRASLHAAARKLTGDR